MGIGSALVLAVLAMPPTVDGWRFTDAQYRAFVEAEIGAMQKNPEWLSCELARCYEPDEYNSSQGFVYWASRHWYLVNKQGEVVLFRPNALQIEYLRSRADENVILKYRKGGASTVVDLLYYWRCRSRPNQHAYIMAHTLDSADELWSRLTFGHEHMRYFLRAPIARSSRKELKFRDNRSHLRIMTAGGHGAGRAADADALHLSEAAHYSDLEEVLAGAGESLRTGAWLDIESTPKGYNRFRTEWENARAPGSTRVPHFFAWYSDPSNRIEPHGEAVRPNPDEEALVAIHGLDAGQLLWRREKIKNLREAFLQEHPEDDESCFLTSGLPLFNNVLLRDLLHVVEARVDPIELDHSSGKPLGPMGSDNARLQVWEVPVPGHRYVIGADVAEGLPGRAWSVAGILDLSTETPEQVAEWRGHINPFEFGQKLAQLGLWYNQAKVAVERNNHGHATLASLRQSAYPSLYKHRHYDQIQGRHVRRLGWPTDGKTRPQMFADLRTCIDEGQMIVRSAGFIHEMMQFQAEDQDREADDFDAGQGASDSWRDRVFAWGIAWQVRKQGDPVVVG